jgi:hypothetical protein
MLGIHATRIGAGTRGDRLETLSLAIAENAKCVDRERGASFRPTESSGMTLLERTWDRDASQTSIRSE